MSAAPIAISHRIQHARRSSALAGAFAPWSMLAPESTIAHPVVHTMDEPALHVSPNSFNFKMASPPLAANLMSSLLDTTIYDPCVVEQEHCTGYECCDLKLGDMHAVMDHFEQAHRVSRLGCTAQPDPRFPVHRVQPIVAPVVHPFLQQVQQSFMDSDSDMFSASSPASTASSDRARSLSIPDEDAEFDIELESRMPQTPPAVSHGSQNVTIVGANGDVNSPDGINSYHFNAFGYAQPPTLPGQLPQYAPVPSKQPAIHSTSTFQSPLLPAGPSIRRSYVDATVRAAAEMRSQLSGQVSPVTVDMGHEQSSEVVEQDTNAHGVDASRTEAYYRPPVFASAQSLYPTQRHPGQQQQQPQQRPTGSRQNSLHVSVPPPLALAQPQHHALPSPSHPYQSQQSQLVQPPPTSAVPSPTIDTRNPTPVRSRNGSMPFPSSSIVTPTLYSPTKRSYDEMMDSPVDDDYEEAHDDEYDEDAEGEYEAMPALGQAIVSEAHVRPAMATSRKDSSSGPSRDSKRAKTGRPKATGRQSRDKDPKRAKYTCPKPGCTKRYMNPNGLKYHMEKGTCTFES